jgi:hypothetical protein
MIFVSNRHAPFDHVTPVRALAPSPRQCGQHGGEIVGLPDRDEADRVPVEVIVAILGNAEVVDM